VVSALPIQSSRPGTGSHDGRYLARARGGRLRPVVLAKHEAAADEEFEKVVARLEDLALEHLSAAHDIADLLVGLAGNRTATSSPARKNRARSVASRLSCLR
jgi:hypothetical protein